MSKTLTEKQKCILIMKSTQLFVFTVIFSNLRMVSAQINDYAPNPPCFPRKAEMLVISSNTSLPICYCKVNNELFLGLGTLDLNVKMNWYIGYYEQHDSLKLVDVFDNFQIDQINLFGDQSTKLNPHRANYYLLKRAWRKSTYKIKRKKRVVYEWWGDDFQRLDRKKLIPLEGC